jgi:hypothetical protein
MFSEEETIAVSMTHHAYAFDWSAFARDELHSILLDALSSGDTNGLIRYIEANRDHLKDRYEGGPLSANWQDVLENFDVHEFGDFALTRFYDPEMDRGLRNGWLAIDEHLSEADRAVLLGTPLGSSSVAGTARLFAVWRVIGLLPIKDHSHAVLSDRRRSASP